MIEVLLSSADTPQRKADAILAAQTPRRCSEDAIPPARDKPCWRGAGVKVSQVAIHTFS